MEFEDVSEEVEREARRVAAASDLDEFQLTENWSRPFQHRVRDLKFPTMCARFRGLWNGSEIIWLIIEREAALQRIHIGTGIEACAVERRPEDLTRAGIVWSPWEMSLVLTPQLTFKEHMSRTLFQLGIEIDDEERLQSLDVSLTAHEKLELRLSLPREFWPQTWREEEAK